MLISSQQWSVPEGVLSQLTLILNPREQREDTVLPQRLLYNLKCLETTCEV